MKNPLKKTWKKMKSLGHTSSSTTKPTLTRSKSCYGSFRLEEDVNSNESKGKSKKESPPTHGFFTVYVGPTKERIVVKTKLLKHPLYKDLLEESETEFGYIRDGPIVLPCGVDFFFKVLAEIKSNRDRRRNDDDEDDDDDDGFTTPPICGILSPYTSNGGYGMDPLTMRRNTSYKLLRSQSFLKLNKF